MQQNQAYNEKVPDDCTDLILAQMAAIYTLPHHNLLAMTRLDCINTLHSKFTVKTRTAQRQGFAHITFLMKV